ncbi:MAG: hypothetical protein Kow00109_10260 [Acidobacteriota bacterium]
MNELVAIARIVRTRGIKGEVVAEILTSFPERFATLAEVWVIGPRGEFRERIENFWFHKGRVILKFAGRDRPHEVEELVGGEVKIAEHERVELPADTFYDSDLKGCRVREGDELVGRVVGVFTVSEEISNLVVEDLQGAELMIPFVADFIKEVDLDRREIVVDLPPGLRDVATPPAGRGPTGRGRAGARRKRDEDRSRDDLPHDARGDLRARDDPAGVPEGTGGSAGRGSPPLRRRSSPDRG